MSTIWSDVCAKAKVHSRKVERRVSPLQSIRPGLVLLELVTQFLQFSRNHRVTILSQSELFGRVVGFRELEIDDLHGFLWVSFVALEVREIRAALCGRHMFSGIGRVGGERFDPFLPACVIPSGLDNSDLSATE